MLTKKNAFAVWLLTGLTLGIYGLVVYERLNREMYAHLYDPELYVPDPRPGYARWWSQLIPVYGLVGLHRTAKALNHYAGGRKVASPVATWLWWSWFVVGSYPYLQHAANKAVS